MEDGRDVRALLRQAQVIPSEIGIFPETHDDDALTMLRHEALAIDHLGKDLVFELLFKNLFDDAEGIATIVAQKVLNVLEKERLRPLRRQDPLDIEKQCALRSALKA